MRSETYRETHRESANAVKQSNQTHQAAHASVTRTRCPACRKLFAIETDTLMAMTRAGAYRAEFNCTSDFCRTAFAIPLPLPEGFDGVTVVPSIQLRPAEVETLRPEQAGTSSQSAAAQNLELEFSQRPEIDFVESDQAAVVEEPTAQSKTKQSAAGVATVTLGVTAVATEKECPRCNAKNAGAMTECVRCGIVFDRYDSGEIGTKADLRVEEEMALGGTRELAALWDKLMEDYEDRVRHDRFVNACRDAKALSYAAKKYSQILVSAPQDEVARLMRNRIVALVSAQAEISRIPIRLDFRIPSMNTMALAMGSILFFWGLMMPQLKNIMEIGLSMVLLSIGVRLALRARV